MADAKYNVFKYRLLRGDIDLNDNTIRLALVTSTYSPNIDTHVDYGDITNEVVGTGYVAKGAEVTGKTFSQVDASDKGKFDADNVVWTNATITARGAVLYVDSGVEATSYLIAYFDFGSDKSSTAADFTAQWHADGILDLA